MAYWKTIIVAGEEIDLSHLEPFEFQILPTNHEQHATISVRFHDHVFTETFDPEKHAERLISNQASLHENRAFCHRRYALSRELPDIIRGLDGRRISTNREGNLIYITFQDGTTYPMFFTLRRETTRRVKMFVVSAYPWDRRGKPSNTGEMKFNLAVAKILQGQPLKFPRR